MYPLFYRRGRGLFGYCLECPTQRTANGPRQSARNAVRPQAETFPESGLSLQLRKSKAEKLIRIANYRLLRDPLWRSATVTGPGERLFSHVRVYVGHSGISGALFEIQFSSQQGRRAATLAPVDGAPANRYGRRCISHPSSTSGEITSVHWFHVSLAAIDRARRRSGACDCGCRAAACAARRRRPSPRPAATARHCSRASTRTSRRSTPTATAP